MSRRGRTNQGPKACPASSGGCAASGRAFHSAIRCRPMAGRRNGRPSSDHPPTDEEVHGHCSNQEWRWLPDDGGSLRLALDYPDGSPVARVERTITPDPDAPAVDLDLHASRCASVPPADRAAPGFPAAAHAAGARARAGRFDDGRTYPGTVEPGAALFAADRRFADLGGGAGAHRRHGRCRQPAVCRRRRGAAADRWTGRQRVARQPCGRLSRPALLAGGAFPEPAALVFEPRPQGSAVERPPSGDRHRADLLALRPRPGNGRGRQPDRALRRADSARLRCPRGLSPHATASRRSR